MFNIKKWKEGKALFILEKDQVVQFTEVLESFGLKRKVRRLDDGTYSIETMIKGEDLFESFRKALYENKVGYLSWEHCF